jgi:hypothetical protein
VLLNLRSNNERNRRMSWSITVPAGPRETVGGRARDALTDHVAQLAEQDAQLHAESEVQMKQAIAAAELLADSGVIGSGNVVVTLSGHANNDYAGSSGVGISIQRVEDADSATPSVSAPSHPIDGATPLPDTTAPPAPDTTAAPLADANTTTAPATDATSTTDAAQPENAAAWTGTTDESTTAGDVSAQTE